MTVDYDFWVGLLRTRVMSVLTIVQRQGGTVRADSTQINAIFKPMDSGPSMRVENLALGKLENVQSRYCLSGPNHRQQAGANRDKDLAVFLFAAHPAIIRSES